MPVFPTDPNSIALAVAGTTLAVGMNCAAGNPVERLMATAIFFVACGLAMAFMTVPGPFAHLSPTFMLTGLIVPFACASAVWWSAECALKAVQSRRNPR